MPATDVTPDTTQKPRRFGSRDALIEYVRGRFMELQRVTIPTGAEPAKGDSTRCGMILHYADGTRDLLSRADAEALLNEGLLARLAIRIELA